MNHLTLDDLIIETLRPLQDIMTPEQINRLSELYMQLCEQFEQHKTKEASVRDGWIATQLLLQVIFRVQLESHIGEMSNPADFVSSNRPGTH